VLECCPGSNVALSVFADYPSHPFARLRDAGAKVTLNSDDPPFFHLHGARSTPPPPSISPLIRRRLLDISRTALEAAFCDGTTKERLLTGAPRRILVSLERKSWTLRAVRLFPGAPVR
jgi:adenosine deaminase